MAPGRIAPDVVAQTARSYHRDMSRELFVHFLPTLVEPHEVRGGVAVVIDLLRASTTIIHAVAAGAKAVIPCLEVEQARAIAANLFPSEVVLGGERHGELIEGFDLDNSPLRYTPEAVGGKTVVFTTTNGTRALLRCTEADRVFVGAFSNLNAVVELLAALEQPVHLVCAGTRGKITAEDVLCAGAIATAFDVAVGMIQVTDDQARIAMDHYRLNVESRIALNRALEQSIGGRDLLELGFGRDIERAAVWDAFRVVPEYSAGTGRVTPATESLAGKQWLAPPR